MKVVLQTRTQVIADLVAECAEGKLPFSGPNSLWSKIVAMGYKPTHLYEMVRAYEEEMKNGNAKT